MRRQLSNPSFRHEWFILLCKVSFNNQVLPALEDIKLSVGKPDKTHVILIIVCEMGKEIF